MPWRHAHENNCYNYAVNIGTNTYAQPIRSHPDSKVNPEEEDYSQAIVNNIVLDGLVNMNTTSIDDLLRDRQITVKRDTLWLYLYHHR